MKTASLFMIGRSQAVQLPSEFHFNGKQVYISRDPRTGNVILSANPPAKPPTSLWCDFIALRDKSGGAPEDFLADRAQSIETRDPFMS